MLFRSYEGDEMPSETEFVNRISPKRTLKVPHLEASEEQLARFAPAEGAAAPADAETEAPASAASWSVCRWAGQSRGAVTWIAAAMGALSWMVFVPCRTVISPVAAIGVSTCNGVPSAIRWSARNFKMSGSSSEIRTICNDRYFRHHHADVCLGGGGTAKNAKRLMDAGLNVLHLPKSRRRQF